MVSGQCMALWGGGVVCVCCRVVFSWLCRISVGTLT